MQIVFNILILFSIYSLIGLSFSLIYYTSKAFYLSHAAIISLGAYFTYLFNQNLTFPFYVSITFAIILSIFFSLFLEILIYKPLRGRINHSFLLLIASLGVYIVLQNIISLVWGDAPLNIRIIEIKPGYHVLGAYITTTQFVIIAINLLAFLVNVFFYNNSKLGKKIRSISTNNELAKVFGINPNNVIIWTNIIGSCLAAIAGILVAYDTNLRSTMGFNLLLYGIVAMIIGGVGSIWGLLSGAFLLASLQQIGAIYIDSKWMEAIAYIILILFLIWKPLGFSGLKLKKTEI